MHEVRRLRQARGWNQTELAFHAGLAPSVISQIENGKRNPSARTLDKLATALNVEVGDLFPKAQAPLPLEEDQDKRGAPFVAAWASYVLRRAEEWKEALPEEGEQLFAKPQLAFEALSRNELVQTEATMLLETVSEAIADTVLSGTDVHVGIAETREGKLSPDTERRLSAHFVVRLEERTDLMELREALYRIDTVADEWCVRTVNREDFPVNREDFLVNREDFLKAAGNAVEEIEKIRVEVKQAKERAERAIEERRNVALMFERSP
jgi:transcriptional regulator with XRE-family HTH domain